MRSSFPHTTSLSIDRRTGPRQSAGRTRHERLDEERAIVIADLSRLLWRCQSTALAGTNPNQPPEVRAARIAENREALTKLNNYYFARSPA
jgi:hypothetical protein